MGDASVGKSARDDGLAAVAVATTAIAPMPAIVALPAAVACATPAVGPILTEAPCAVAVANAGSPSRPRTTAFAAAVAWATPAVGLMCTEALLAAAVAAARPAAAPGINVAVMPWAAAVTVATPAEADVDTLFENMTSSAEYSPEVCGAVGA